MLPLYEQYRPRSWADVVGQDKAIAKIETLRRRGLAGRAFWINGQSGTGKSTIGKLIAAEVADEWAIEEIDAESLTPSAAADLERKSYSKAIGKGGWAFLVNESHGLKKSTVRQLLVTLERIPAHVVWIFTTTIEGEGKATAERYAAKRPPRVCAHCGKVFYVYPASTARYCGQKCKQTAISRRTAKTRGDKQRGKGSGIGGGIKPTTYQKLNGRHAHRTIAEQKLGRELLPGEIVHHIDGNRHNNNSDNLQVMTQGEHARLHSTKNRLCDYPGCNRKHAAKGLCMMHWRRARKGKLAGYLTASDEH